MSKTIAFWELFDRYKIEIPIIQRDYAQGRKDEKAINIRTEIIKKIFSGEGLTFDFIYGRVQKGCFVPIDGQQRLTTLWLVHLYFLKQCPDNSCEEKSCLKKLKRFTYATRLSSREFCEAITNEDISIIPAKGKIEDFIKDQPWFFSDWELDPTIAGMLRMLDEIHTQAQGKDFQTILQNLLQKKQITFQFLDMGEQGLTDDLYLRMNARGLPLTCWENFKAKLEQYLDDKEGFKIDILPESAPSNWVEMNFAKKFIWKLDRDWLDFFWEKSSENAENDDEAENMMMTLFRRHFLNIWRLRSKSNDDKEVARHLEKKLNNDDFVAFDIYERVLNLEDGIKQCLLPLSKMFDTLSEGKSLDTAPAWRKKKEWDPLTGDWNNENTETYASRVRFYAVVKFFDQDKVFDREQYQEWMRIIWNIVENSTSDQSTLHSILTLIDELSKGVNDIIAFLSGKDSKIESDYAKEQVDEEREKAILIKAIDPKVKYL